MASTRNSNRTRAGTSRNSSSDRSSRTTSRTGAWDQVVDQVKRHPVLAATAAGVLAMGVGAYALLRKNGGRR